MSQPKKKRVLRDFSEIKTHIIRGKKYLMRWKRPAREPLTDGKIDSPRDKDLRLFIYPHQVDPLLLLETVIHENIHGACYDLDEDTVEAACAATMRLLRRMKIKVEFQV